MYSFRVYVHIWCTVVEKVIGQLLYNNVLKVPYFYFPLVYILTFSNRLRRSSSSSNFTRYASLANLVFVIGKLICMPAQNRFSLRRKREIGKECLANGRMTTICDRSHRLAHILGEFAVPLDVGVPVRM